MKIDKVFSAFAAFGAGWVFWLLVALSVVALAVAVDRVVCLLASREDVPALERDVLGALAKGSLEKALTLLKQSPSYEAKVALAGLSAKGDRAAREKMAGETKASRLALEKNLSVLATIGANAPFVGLLGTVIGIVGAFRELESAHGRVTAHLMSEIGEALVATAVGLLVALPAVSFYNGFRRVVSSRLSRAEAFGHHVLAHLVEED